MEGYSVEYAQKDDDSLTTEIHDHLLKREIRRLKAQGYELRACNLGLGYYPDAFAVGPYTGGIVFVEVDYLHETPRDKIRAYRKHGKVVVVKTDGRGSRRIGYGKLANKHV